MKKQQRYFKISNLFTRKSGLNFVQFYSRSLQNLLLTFQIVFENLSCTCVLSLELLLLNSISFLPFLHKDLSKSRRCHFLLLQTQPCDVNIQRAITLILKGVNGQILKIFSEVTACGVCTK